jgi:uncharacterized membrane protein
MANSIPQINDSPYKDRLRARRRVIRSFVTKYNKNRSFAEKAADSIANFCGSIEFFVLNFIWFLVWIMVNTGLVPGIEPFDPFPFGLLTMIVSLEAIFLSIFVLISQNRQSKIADLRAEIDMQVNMIAEEEITKVMQMVHGLYKGLKVNMVHDPEIEEMMKPLDRSLIEKRLEEQMKDPESIFGVISESILPGKKK